MKERVGEQYRGRITGVAPFGIFVTLESLYVEGMVHVSELGSEYFQFNETSHELRGERTGQRYRLTDEIDVQVSRVNLEGRRIDFRLVQDGGSRQRAGGDGPTAGQEAGAAAGRRSPGRRSCGSQGGSRQDSGSTRGPGRAQGGRARQRRGPEPRLQEGR